MYISEDHGQTWKKIADHVLRSIFVTTDGSNEFIFYSTTSSIPQLYPLYRYNIKTRKTDGKFKEFCVTFNFVTQRSIKQHIAFLLTSTICLCQDKTIQQHK